MKLVRVFVFVSAISLILASLASGLELSTSIGGNDGTSSMNVHYGATVDDYKYEHIHLILQIARYPTRFRGRAACHLALLAWRTKETMPKLIEAFRESGTTK